MSKHTKTRVTTTGADFIGAYNHIKMQPSKFEGRTMIDCQKELIGAGFTTISTKRIIEIFDDLKLTRIRRTPGNSRKKNTEIINELTTLVRDLQKRVDALENEVTNPQI